MRASFVSNTASCLAWKACCSAAHSKPSSPYLGNDSGAAAGSRPTLPLGSSFPFSSSRISYYGKFGVNSGVQKLPKNPINSSLPTPAFIKGQLWQLFDTTRFIQIGHVGRLLVHHRTIVPS